MKDMSLRPSFPTTVNTTAARVVAGSVAAVGTIWLITGHWAAGAWLGTGFVLRVLYGPRYDPTARAAIALAQRLGPAKLTAGAPKRFAQGMGATFVTITAITAALGGPWQIPLAGLIGAATLEAAAGICLGCHIHAGLTRIGVAKPCEVCT